MRPPSRDTCDLCFEHKMIVSKTKNTFDSNANLHDDDADDDMLLEDQLLQSADHAKMARAQRSECNEAVRLARKSKEDCSTFCVTVNCAQNLVLPHFGDEQPGVMHATIHHLDCTRLV